MIENRDRRGGPDRGMPPGKTRDALRAAHLYYMQDLTMDAIAHELHTSRSSVSRLFSHARASGLVEISIHSPLDLPSRIEQEILARSRVVAHVVPVPDHASDVDRLERVALSAARILGRFIDSNHDDRRRLGLDDERDEPPPRPEGDPQLRDRAAQRRGQPAHHRHPLRERASCAASATRSARACSSSPCPRSSTTPTPKQAFWRERSTRRLLDLQAAMDVALFGVGSPFAEVPSHVYQGGYLERADFEALSREGAVGDVATVFYRADGSTDGIAAERAGDRPGLRGAPPRAAAHLRRLGPRRSSRASAGRSPRGSSPTSSSTRARLGPSSRHPPRHPPSPHDPGCAAAGRPQLTACDGECAGDPALT